MTPFYFKLYSFYVRFRRFIRKIQGKYVEVYPTSHDTNVIQNRIDYVAEHGGGIVHLNKGLYIIEAPIKLKSNITLEGESQ